MCRLFGFHSCVSSGIHHSLIGAENALMNQSAHHPDGWGVAFYEEGFPHLIRHERSAIEDKLFKDVSAIVSTRTLLAHVRQATVGEVNLLNCHPFQYGCWTFAHNGEVAGYEDPTVRQALRADIPNKYARHLLGTTDSETIFFLFLSYLSQAQENVLSPDMYLGNVVEALRRMVDRVLQVEKSTKEPSKLSFIVTNGQLMLGYRHVRPLRFSTHKKICPERDVCPAFSQDMCEKALAHGEVRHLILASEEVSSSSNVWEELQEGEYAAVDPFMVFRRAQL